MTAVLLQELGLKPALAKAVEKKARHEGKTAPEYVRSLIERDLLADRSFDDILRPVRSDFRRNAISEGTLDQIIERARGPRTRRTPRKRS